jgi:hypothetical protein
MLTSGKVQNSPTKHKKVLFKSIKKTSKTLKNRLWIVDNFLQKSIFYPQFKNRCSQSKTRAKIKEFFRTKTKRCKLYKKKM